MAKIRKQHNPQKRWFNQARSSLIRHKLCVAYSYAHHQHQTVQVFNRKTLKPLTILNGSVTQKALAEVRHRWTIVLAVLCRDQFGQHYIKSELIEANEPYLQSELADFCEDQHRNLILSCNENHIINICWIGCPWGGDFDEAEVAKIFDTLDFWEHPEKEVVNG